MLTTMRWLGLVAFFVPLVASLPALADVPPGDVCGEVGAACHDALPDFKTPGICTKTTCSRRNLSTGKDYDYECLKCVPTGAKAPPPPASSVPPSTSSAPTTPAPATPPTPTDKPKSSGCQLGGTESGTGAFFVFAAFALLGLRRGR